MTDLTSVTLVTGKSAAERESAIAAMIAHAENPDRVSATRGFAISTAVILEGMSSGADPLAAIARNNSHIAIMRIAPGCPCCIGNLTMRVTLNRILRHPPTRLYISLATATHLDQTRSFLMQQPYDKFLAVAKDIQV